MTGNDYSRQVNIQCDVSRSSIVLGDRNQVSNQISQLGETEKQIQLKALLTLLQSAIAADPILNEEEQTDALIEVGEIALAAQSLNEEANKQASQKAIKRSLNTLKGIILSIGEVTHLTETAKPQLDAIAHLFSL
ncbi:MAG: hypothetical protein AAFZ17_09895 [Cyanobacteria bacterium J06650_10]